MNPDSALLELLARLNAEKLAWERRAVEAEQRLKKLVDPPKEDKPDGV